MEVDAYSKQGCIKTFIKKTKELGRFPTVGEIDEDYRFPSYGTFLKYAGRLCDLKRKYKHLVEDKGKE